LIKVFVNGLVTGFILQIAIGPVFFFVVNLALQRTLLDGMAAVAAVTIVDYLFILLAVFGAGKLLEGEKTKKTMGFISSAVLVFFGLFMIMSQINTGSITMYNITDSGTVPSSFFTAFTLTLASPITIVFWTGLFTAKSIEKNYRRKELFVFGLAAGFTAVLFLGATVILLTFFKTIIPISFARNLNLLVGFLLVAYGSVRFVQIFQTAPKNGAAAH
jgi:threonine/homoserine/homoserine lactone efflux protein